MHTMCMRYMDMDPDQLREAYTAWRSTLYGWTQVAQPRRNDRGRSANGTGRALAQVELIENIARKRGVRL
jgi:ribonuclease PH